MTTLGFYFPMGKEAANALRSDLNEVAASLGFTAHRGPTAGQGNAAEMFGALVAGELAIFHVPYEELRIDGDEMNELRRIKEQAHPYTGHILDYVIAALEEAIRRKEKDLYGSK